MSSNAPATVVDCRGMQCPAPIISVAKAAKALRGSGGTLQVLADDEAFPLDVKSWCRSSQATLLRMENINQGFRATIRVNSASTQRPPEPEASSAVSSNEAVQSIDCLGMSCPEPILTLAKAARGAPGGTVFELVADDPAFPTDVKSWCRSAGAELIDVNEDAAPYRAKLRTKGGTPLPPARSAAPAEPAPAAPAQPPPPTAAPASEPSSGLRIDLSWFEPDQRLLELRRALATGGGATRATVIMPDRQATNELLSWCGQNGHSVCALSGDGPMTAEIELGIPSPGGASVPWAPSTALVPAGAPSNALALAPEADNRCSLLVLHNDHEALLAALLIATGAAASGMNVSIFFTFWGLNLLRGDRPNEAAPKEKVTFIQRLFKWMMPRGTKKQKLGQMNFGGAGKGMLDHIMKSQNIMLLPELIQSAQDQGVEFIACTMSMGVMGITKRDLHPYETLEFGGVATFVERARGSAIHMVF